MSSQLRCPNVGCNMVFKYRMERKRHVDNGKCKGTPPQKTKDYGLMQNVSILENGAYLCGICKTEIKFKNNIYRHKRLCKGPQKFKPTFSCGVCDKVFVFKSKLQEHVKVHNNEALICEKCYRSF